MSWWTSQRKAYAAAALIRGASLSTFGAAGLVSRWANVESTASGPTAVNPSSHAFGIAQWLGSRLPPIKGNTNFDAQLNYAVRELNSSEGAAGNVLRNAHTIDEAARGASMYERAEGYNRATGRDNHTARTAAGVAEIVALLGGGQPTNPIIAKSGDSGEATTLDDGVDQPRNLSPLVIAGTVIGLAYLLLK